MHSLQLAMHNQESVAVFWDFEHARPNDSLSGYEIVKHVRECAQAFGIIRSFKMYLDTTSVSPTLRSEFQSSGVTLIDVLSFGDKDMTTKTMLVDLMTHAMDSPTIFVIVTGDRSLAYAASSLRMRNFTVVILPPAGTHTNLATHSSAPPEFNNMVLEKINVNVDPRVNSHSATTSISSNCNTNPNDPENIEIHGLRNCALPGSFRSTPASTHHAFDKDEASTAQPSFLSPAAHLYSESSLGVQNPTITQSKKIPTKPNSSFHFSHTDVAGDAASESVPTPNRCLKGKEQEKYIIDTAHADLLPPSLDSLLYDLRHSTQREVGAYCATSIMQPTPLSRRSSTSSSLSSSTSTSESLLIAPFAASTAPTSAHPVLKSDSEPSAAPHCLPQSCGPPASQEPAVAVSENQTSDTPPCNGSSDIVGLTAPIIGAESGVIAEGSSSALGKTGDGESKCPLSSPLPAVSAAAQTVPAIPTHVPAMVQPLANTPSATSLPMTAATRAIIVAPHFRTLVDCLRDHRKKGKNYVSRSTLGGELPQREPGLYKRAGFTTFAQYIEAAHAAGLVTLHLLNNSERAVALHPTLT